MYIFLFSNGFKWTIPLKSDTQRKKAGLTILDFYFFYWLYLEPPACYFNHYLFTSDLQLSLLLHQYDQYHHVAGRVLTFLLLLLLFVLLCGTCFLLISWASKSVCVCVWVLNCEDVNITIYCDMVLEHICTFNVICMHFKEMHLFYILTW